MGSYYFADIQDQLEERAFDVREPEYDGQPEDFDERPDPEDLLPAREASDWHGW